MHLVPYHLDELDVGGGNVAVVRADDFLDLGGQLLAEHADDGPFGLLGWEATAVRDIPPVTSERGDDEGCTRVLDLLEKRRVAT